VLAVLCALASSLMYALASVLQQRGAAAQPADQSLKLGLLIRLIRHPGWVIGLVCDVVGFVLQFIALGHGPLVVVQPLLVCGLLFALPLEAALKGRRLHPADWMAALMVCAGLAVFLVMAHPAQGRDNARVPVWVVLLLADAGVALALVALSLGRDARHKAVFLSGAAGVIYGAAAALTKTSSHLLNGGVIHALGHWQPYVLVVFGVGGMVLGQSAFQAGALDVSLPTMSVADPVVSIMIGALVFEETISDATASVFLEVVGLIVMSIGIVLLARGEVAGTVRESPPQPA